jgi:hypothetical protein
MSLRKGNLFLPNLTTYVHKHLLIGNNDLFRLLRTLTKAFVKQPVWHHLCLTIYRKQPESNGQCLIHSMKDNEKQCVKHITWRRHEKLDVIGIFNVRATQFRGEQGNETLGAETEAGPTHGGDGHLGIWSARG